MNQPGIPATINIPKAPPPPKPRVWRNGKYVLADETREEPIMTALELLNHLADEDATLRPHGVSSVTVDAAAGVLTEEVVASLRAHKELLGQWVRGSACCYRPGLLLPADLDLVERYRVYHFPLPAGIVGILQVKGDGVWTWYEQYSPGPLINRGDRAGFEAHLASAGLTVHPSRGA